MSSLFLTKEELTELTGYQRPKSQKQWLSRKKLHYLTGADGMPRVLRQSLLAKYKALPATPAAANDDEPRLRF